MKRPFVQVAPRALALWVTTATLVLAVLVGPASAQGFTIEVVVPDEPAAAPAPAPESPTSRGPLPRTGSDAATLALTAVSLLVLGTAINRLTRPALAPSSQENPR